MTTEEEGFLSRLSHNAAAVTWFFKSLDNTEDVQNLPIHNNVVHSQFHCHLAAAAHRHLTSHDISSPLLKAFFSIHFSERKRRFFDLIIQL